MIPGADEAYLSKVRSRQPAVADSPVHWFEDCPDAPGPVVVISRSWRAVQCLTCRTSAGGSEGV